MTAGRLDEIARLELGFYPTPVEEMPRLRAALGGGPRLLVKRDDYTGPGFGGNKVRKLEYLLARAVADGADTVITCGGLKSNHARITAALAARVGLKCVLVLNGSPGGRRPASLWVDEMTGAEIQLVAGGEERAPKMEEIAARLRAAGRTVSVIPLGASTPLGALGYVRAVRELAGQLEGMRTQVDFIFHSTSSGGTQAGLEAGRQLLLPGARVVGVSADDPAAEIGAAVARNIRGIRELLGLAGLSAEAQVVDDYVGPGYGIESEAGREALALAARTEGLFLDPVYTAKAMAGLIGWIRQGRLPAEATVLFWHTGGQLALFDAA